MRVLSSLLLVSATSLLSGCVVQLDDLNMYVEEVRQNTPVSIEPYPEFTRQDPYLYASASLRSPFSRPKKQVVEVAQAPQANCMQPNLARDKQPLERYGLDALNLSGSFTGAGKRWVLVKTNDGRLYQATQGDYIGLFYGQITQIRADGISITEMLPDGAGCWQSKTSELSMATTTGEEDNV